MNRLTVPTKGYALWACALMVAESFRAEFDLNQRLKHREPASSVLAGTTTKTH
jgi:hypothetical protein